MTELLNWRHFGLAPLLTICATTWAYAQHWGDFKKDSCTKPGYSQYSAILWDIPVGQSWEQACAKKDATIEGHYFLHPDRCKNTGTNMWGEFDVPDSSCTAKWGNFQRGACAAIGKRKYSAQILNVPPGQKWEDACAHTPATVQGQVFSTPSGCNNTGVTGEWGQFDVNDSSCEGHWSSFNAVRCTMTGKREYEAQLTVPDGLSWETTCAATPATVAGESLHAPTRCENRGVGGEWGLFDVNEGACEVHLLPNQWPNPNPDPNRPIWGFADTHNHQFAYLAFGGKFIAGEVFDSADGGKPDAIKRALHYCDWFFGPLGPPFHGPWGQGDFIGTLMETAGYHLNGHGAGAGGYPEFNVWPAWNSINHQQGYYQWLKRAHAGGLQLMVMNAVNSAYLCGKVSTLPGFGCDDMAAADRQLDAAKRLEAYVDKYDGGWYRIVHNSAEARQAIHKGQLAVVLGIEVDDLFHCGTEPNLCSNDDRGKQYVTQQLQKYYDAGVRHIFPIHGTDNAFGGPCLFEGIYLAANVQMNHQPFVLSFDCPEVNYSFRPDKDSSSLLSVLEPGFTAFPTSDKGICNAVGLNPMGQFLVKEMMKRHMIIDIDHLSWKAANEVFAIAESYNPNYPVISSHSGYIATSTGTKKSEGQKNESQMKRIWMAGVITAQGVTDLADPAGVPQYVPKTWHAEVANDCSNSSKTFAQAYLYAVDVMGGPAKARVALATDMMGGIYQPGPRFGENACYSKNDARKSEMAKQGPPPSQGGKGVSYPFTLVPGKTIPLYQSRACDGRDFNSATTDCQTAEHAKVTFDFNYDGLAHVGMLPDLIQDLRNVGLTDNDLNPLFRSAEAYIEMWEKAERLH